MMEGRAVKKVILDRNCSANGLVRKVLENIPSSIPVVREEPAERCSLGQEALDDMGKEVLHLVHYKGDLIKPCPGTRKYICCGYMILNIGANCPIDCSYCILQSYFNQPYLRVYANLEEDLDKALEFIDNNPQKTFRLGTGEFMDSLAIDPITQWSRLVLPAFSRRKNAVLELKTKTTRIEGLISSESRARIIVSWSLSNPYIASREEHGAPGLLKRLEAAKRCQEEGYVLGFHFDPMIYHPGWEDATMRTLELLDRYIDPGGLIWISMGSFRYMPGLKEIIRRRHPDSCILNGEFIPGIDGKMRYFKPIRIELYSFLKEKLLQWHPDPGLYLCMESDDVWRKTMGWTPADSAGLSEYLDGRVARFFG